uniref:Uncharacterized protein n=1 Tax=Arundo donax TaxID=35708 RepID=A0A0A8XTP4_ARUDO
MHPSTLRHSHKHPGHISSLTGHQPPPKNSPTNRHMRQARAGNEYRPEYSLTCPFLCRSWSSDGLVRRTASACACA